MGITEILSTHISSVLNLPLSLRKLQLSAPTFLTLGGTELLNADCLSSVSCHPARNVQQSREADLCHCCFVCVLKMHFVNKSYVLFSACWLNGL